MSELKSREPEVDRLSHSRKSALPPEAVQLADESFRTGKEREIYDLATEDEAHSLLRQVRAYAKAQNRGVRGTVFEDESGWGIQFRVATKRVFKSRKTADAPTPQPAQTVPDALDDLLNV